MDAQGQWARLLGAVRTAPPERRRHALSEALQVGMTVVGGMRGCSITEIGPDGGRTPLTVNELALSLDEAQYQVHSGPCVEAAVQRCAQRVDVMSQDPRFSAFTNVAVVRGVHSSLSLPLAGGALPTALNLYAATPGVFQSARTRAVADLLARCTSALLGDAGIGTATDNTTTSAYAQGELVRRAQQVLAEQHGLTGAQAYSELVDCSRQLNRSIVAVATDVLERTGQKYSDQKEITGPREQ